MTYSAAEARQQLLEDLGRAIDDLGAALAVLGTVYELLDEHTADRLEEELFRPVQMAYGRAKRTYTGFAARHGLSPRAFEAAAPGRPSQGPLALLDAGLEAVGEADLRLVEIQDSMRPVEVGDAELRAGLAETRELVGPLPGRARELVRVLGR
jgi:hypothetical protein